MNRFIFLFIYILFIACSNVSAQESEVKKKHYFYLRPFVGAGITNINATTTNPAYNDDIKEFYNPIFSTTGGVNAGIQIKQLRIETGLQFLTTGRHFDFGINAFSPGTPGILIDSFRVTETHQHIIIPISAGHTFNINNKFSITPMAGVGIGRHMGVSSKRESYITGAVHKSSSTINTSVHNAFNIWGNVFVNFEYYINNRIAISITPTFNRMITNSLKEEPGAIFEYKERHYSVTGNAGVLIRL